MYDPHPLKIWDLSSRRCTHTLSDHTGSVYAFAVANGHLLSASSDTTIKVRFLSSSNYNSNTCLVSFRSGSEGRGRWGCLLGSKSDDESAMCKGGKGKDARQKKNK